jgi:intracellular multiplication protein IcmJ
VHLLNLSINPSAWRSYSARKADPAFRAFREKILDRDNFTCQFCGFQAREYQDIVNVDNDYRNNKLSNMATACIFCAQCFFIESAGFGESGGGTLVYLPELTQPELNSFCHVLFCAITNNTGYKESAQSIYRSLKFRSQVIEKRFGDGTADPTVFGQMVIDSGQDLKEVNEIVLSSMRLLPSRGKFRKQIEHWARKALEELSSEAE